MTIKVGDKFKTRGGHEVEITHIHEKGSHPVCGRVKVWSNCSWSLDGKWGSLATSQSKEHELDLVTKDDVSADQFQSGNYAALVARLRITTEQMACSASVDMTLWNKHSNACLAAADAIKTLLAKRDALKAELDKAQEIARVQAERIGGYIKTIEDREAERDASIERFRYFGELHRQEHDRICAERDALLARLAPVEDEKLAEIAVKEVEKVIASSSDSETVGGARWKALRAAIAAVRPHIEAATLSDLTEFSKHKSWSLNYKRPFYCDDDDQEQCWVVYEEIGPINDRDWNIIGKGDTVAEAIASAIKTGG